MMDWGSGFQLLFADGLWLDEGVEELRQEKKVTSPLSTQEEIEKLTIDENLSPIQRALVLIKGQPLQQICVLNELPNKIKSNGDFLYKFVPEVCTALKTAPLEVQRHAAICFASIIRSHVLQPHISATVLLPTVLVQLRSLHPDIGQCWLDTAKVCMEHLPKDVIRKEFVTLVCEMGRLSQTVTYRVTACELCGVLVTKFEPYWINKELWPLVRSLCQDVDLSVRSTMTQNLSKVAAALGKDLSKCVLTEITLLIEDEELSVKVVAVEALVDIVPHVNKVSGKEILSLFIRVCKAAMVKKDKLLVAVSGVFGRAVHNLEDYMEEDETSWFLEFYKDLCRFESVSRNESNSSVSVVMNLEDCDVECRRWAAFNAPALVLFCGSRTYLGSLHHCIVRLSQDPSFVVRRQLAFGLHEIMKYLKVSSSNTVVKVLPVYQHLLRDSHEEVIEGVLQHLDEVLTMLSGLSGFSIQPAMPDFIGSLLSCERQLQSKLQWRLQESFISKISFVEGLVSPEQLYSKFVPVTFKYISGNVVYPVRLAASKTLLHYLRHMRRADYRDEICTRITSDCLGCSSYKGRLMFLDIIEMIMELFSWSFFKQTFFKSVLQLSSDKIVNVRMRFYRMLPSLKRCLKLPSDRLLLKELEGCVRMAISSEMDAEASNCLRESVAELDQVNVTLEVYSRQTYFEDEIIDQQKEEEEKQLWVENTGVVSKQHANDSIKRCLSSDDRLKSASFTRVYSEKGGKAPQSKPSGKKPLYSPQISKKTSNHGSSGPGSSTPPNTLKLPGTSKSNSVSQLVKKSTCPSGNTPGSLPSSGEGSCNSTPGSSPTTDRTNSLQNLTTSQKVQKTKNSSPLISRRNTSPHILKSTKTTTKVQKTPSKEIVSPSGSTAKRKISQKSKKL